VESAHSIGQKPVRKPTSGSAPFSRVFPTFFAFCTPGVVFPDPFSSLQNSPEFNTDASHNAIATSAQQTGVC
jgi:hypothetical protein